MMYASIFDLTQIILRNALFVVGQAVVLFAFMFLLGGVLFLIKGKRGV